MTAGKETTNLQKILVVDDEEIVRILFQSLFEDEGLVALLAEDGTRGAQLLDQYSPAVALVDKNLPDISGLDFIAAQRIRHPNTEFIMITGYASLDSAVKAMELGAFSYLTKPFDDMSLVMDRIRAAMEVNNLRAETSQLRDRLAHLANKPNLDPASSKPLTGTSKELTQRVGHTIAFLETFLDKRDKPPAPAAWTRIVDMIEQEVHLLKQPLSDKK
jgi:DNA-binding NtrC family response regulator